MNNPQQNPYRMRQSQQQFQSADNRPCAMDVYYYGFVMYEALLFLDTHPTDAQALQYYREVSRMYLAAKKVYEETIGPLTLDSVDSDNYWAWVKTPWPWEMEA